MTDRDPLLVEREKTHGSFRDNAQIWSDLCKQIPGNWGNAQQRLAVAQILLKIARAVSSPNIKDHWDDIAGYAKLGSEACE